MPSFTSTNHEVDSFLFYSLYDVCKCNYQGTTIQNMKETSIHLCNYVHCFGYCKLSLLVFLSDDVEFAKLKQTCKFGVNRRALSKT